MSQFNINDEVALSDGTTLTFGNAVSVFVSDVRETNDISWSVLDFTQLSGDAIRKRASRLYSTSITVVADDEGVGFNFKKIMRFIKRAENTKIHNVDGKILDFVLDGDY